MLQDLSLKESWKGILRSYQLNSDSRLAFQENSSITEATVSERLARPPPTTTNLVQSPAGSLDLRKWESCRTMPLFPPSIHSGPAPFSLKSPSSALKTSLLRAAQISSLTHSMKSIGGFFNHGVPFGGWLRGALVSDWPLHTAEDLILAGPSGDELFTSARIGERQRSYSLQVGDGIVVARAAGVRSVSQLLYSYVSRASSSWLTTGVAGSSPADSKQSGLVAGTLRRLATSHKSSSGKDLVLEIKKGINRGGKEDVLACPSSRAREGRERPPPAVTVSAALRFRRDLRAPSPRLTLRLAIFSRSPCSSYAWLHHRGSKLDPRLDLRSTLKTVPSFRIGLEIEMKFISNRRNWLFEISIRHQQPSSTNIDESEIKNHDISLVQYFYIGTKIKLDSVSELGSFDLGSGMMLVQPGISWFHKSAMRCVAMRRAIPAVSQLSDDLSATDVRYDGNTARLARRSDEPLGVRVTVARIAPLLLDLGRGVPTGKYYFAGAAVAEQLHCSPPTKANRVQYPVGSIPDFRKWEKCQTMPLFGGFSQGSPVSSRLFILVLIYTHFTRDADGNAARHLTTLRVKAGNDDSAIVGSRLEQTFERHLSRQLHASLLQTVTGAGTTSASRRNPFFNYNYQYSLSTTERFPYFLGVGAFIVAYPRAHQPVVESLFRRQLLLVQLLPAINVIVREDDFPRDKRQLASTEDLGCVIKFVAKTRSRTPDCEP
ncbi:hypothetical protein PR048_015551 [Dryococelus australis]|uniref:Uncharacterized protein n=1 Tax=Dryococelus australis TaxID=614101 RepID=A0ABQ9HH93_9NEOP|nr:hypothetical protein PR048_015551 [Dryococelus australis]